MFNISSYLEKFKRLEPPGDSVKIVAQDVIFEVVGVKIEKKDMSVKDSVLFLSVPSIIKNEVYMNKRGILEKVNGLLKEKMIKDIR
jgi:hypothetical protein